MSTLHFTDMAVSRLKTPGTYYDETTPAFGLRVGKNRKTWFVIRGRERLRTTIGRYPAISLSDARTRAKKLLTEPVVKTDRTRFGEAYTAFLEAKASRKPRTVAEYKRHMERHFVPRFETRKLPEVIYEELMDAVKDLPPGEQAHALAVARIFFRWCLKPPRRYITANPLDGVYIAPSKKRKRVLKPEELVNVWRAALKQGYPHGTVVQLLILNGQRKTETVNLRWPWINQRERLITLPEWVTKNSKEHTFPYGQMTADIFETVPRLNSTDLLFPSRVSDERPFSGWGKYKAELDGLSGVAHHTLHDLRRTFRTVHAQIGTSREIGERLINHAAAVVTDVEEIYDLYTYLPEMRQAVENFEAHLSTLLQAA
jgi:integrase